MPKGEKDFGMGERRKDNPPKKVSDRTKRAIGRTAVKGTGKK